jgi:hypothetical protein
MKKPSALESALRNSGATVSASQPSEPAPAPLPHPRAQPVSRQATKAITVHFPEEVRRQLKSMAAEEGRSMEDMVAEALNLLFVRHRRPELAPRKSSN